MERFLAEAAINFHPEHYRIGPAPDEVVFYYAISRSAFDGPRVQMSAVSKCGGEWCRMRGDGVMSLESKHVLRTRAGHLVYTTFSGIYDIGDDGYVDALDDSLLTTAHAALTVRFYTAAKEYRWLNRTQFTGLGLRDFATHELRLRISYVEP
jgi:Protein of unknown function (DUF3237)